MFRAIRKLRTFRSFAESTENLAKSAKSDQEINKDNQSTIHTGTKRFDSDCEAVKSAKSAKSANFDQSNSDAVDFDVIKTSFELEDIFKEEGF
jgi:hypothetical protein